LENYWSDGALEYWKERHSELLSRRSGKNSVFQNHNTFRISLFIAFTILQYSTTPTLPQKDSYTTLPGITQSRSLRTRILYDLVIRDRRRSRFERAREQSPGYGFSIIYYVPTIKNLLFLPPHFFLKHL